MCAFVHGHASAGVGPALCVVVMSAGGLFRSVVSGSSSLKQAQLLVLHYVSRSVWFRAARFAYRQAFRS